MKVTASEVTENLEPWAQKAVNKLPPDRKQTVLDFLQALDDEGVGMAAKQTYIGALRTLDGGKNYNGLEEPDIRAWVREIDAHYKPSGAWLYKFAMRKFIKWVHTGDLNGGEYPKCVSWIKQKRRKRGLGREILSQAEVKRLIDGAESQRNRALLFVLYESGARAGEMANLKIKDFEPDQYGGILRLDGKTGPRRIRIFEAVPDLQLWLSMHPDKDNPEAPLWLGRRFKDKPIHRRTLFDIVVEHAGKAGIKKKISPHSFRHSRATVLATVLKEAQMREFFGWSKNSDMPSIYVHLSGRDVDQSLFEHYGIKPREELQDSPLKKKICPRCNVENSASARFCWRCWAAFDTAKADEITARVMEELIKRAPDLLRQVLKEKGLDQEIAELSRGG